MALFPSSYMVTGGATVTRNADQLSSPFDARPQATTVYARFIELGSIETVNARLWEIGAGPTKKPRLLVYVSSTGTYSAFYQGNGTNDVQSDVSPTVALGDGVELLTQLSTVGDVRIKASINGGTISAGTTTAAIVFPEQWSDKLLWFNSAGATNIGFVGLRNVVAVRGVKTMDQMRRIAGVA